MRFYKVPRALRMRRMSLSEHGGDADVSERGVDDAWVSAPACSATDRNRTRRRSNAARHSAVHDAR